jgi:hypothetical protein
MLKNLCHWIKEIVTLAYAKLLVLDDLAWANMPEWHEGRRREQPQLFQDRTA